MRFPPVVAAVAAVGIPTTALSPASFSASCVRPHHRPSMLCRPRVGQSVRVGKPPFACRFRTGKKASIAHCIDGCSFAPVFFFFLGGGGCQASWGVQVAPCQSCHTMQPRRPPSLTSPLPVLPVCAAMLCFCSSVHVWDYRRPYIPVISVSGHKDVVMNFRWLEAPGSGALGAGAGSGSSGPGTRRKRVSSVHASVLSRGGVSSIALEQEGCAKPLCSRGISWGDCFKNTLR